MENRDYESEIRAYRRMITGMLNRERRNNRSNKDTSNNNKSKDYEQYTRRMTDIMNRLSSLGDDSIKLNEDIIDAIENGDKVSEKRFREELRNNRDTTRQLNDMLKSTKSAISRLDELNDSVGDMNDNLKVSFESLRDTLTAFNVGNIGNSLSDDAINAKDIYRDIAKNSNRTIEEIAKVSRDGFISSSKTFSNIFTSSEFAQAFQDVAQDVKNTDEATTKAGYMLAYEKVTGNAITDLNNILTYNDEKSYKALLDQSQTLKNIENISSDDNLNIVGSIDEMSSSFHNLAKGDFKKIADMNSSALKYFSAFGTNSIDNYDQISQMINDIAGGMSISDVRDTYGQAAANAQVMGNIKKGNIDDALKVYTEGMFRDINSMSSKSFSQSRYGDILDEDTFKKIKSGDLTYSSFSKQLNDIGDQMSSSTLEDSSKLIQHNLPYLEKIYNAFSTTGLGGAFENIKQNDIVEAFGGGISSVLGPYLGTKLANSGVASMIPKSIKGKVAGSTMATALTGGSKGLMSLLGKAAPWLSIGSAGLAGTKGLFDMFNGNTSLDRTRGGVKAGLNLGAAGAGAALGTFVFPGLGTVLGAAIGSGVGGLTDFFGGDWIADKVNSFKESTGNFLSNLGSGISGTFDKVSSWWSGLWDNNGIATSSGSRAKSGYDVFNSSPRYQSGLDRVAKNGQYAVLHKDEAVLNRADADLWRQEKNALNSMSLTSKLTDASLLQKMNESRESYASMLNSSTATSQGPGNMVALNGNTQASSFANKEDFINALGQIAQKNRGSVDILPSFVVAQSLYEGAWPLSNLAKKNNLWGIKAGSNWSGDKGEYTTTEYKNGKGYKTKAWFRHYPSLENGFSDHAKLFTNDRYKEAIGVSDPSRIVSIIKKGGYFTGSESDYISSINSLINSNNLTRFDKLNAYKKGTPYVPSDQLALLHKGEMVVPSQFNPANKGTTISGNDELLSEFRAYMSIFKNAVSYLASKIESSDSENYYKSKSKLSDKYHSNKLRGAD